jgi:hypothetical protein
MLGVEVEEFTNLNRLQQCQLDMVEEEQVEEEMEQQVLDQEHRVLERLEVLIQVEEEADLLNLYQGKVNQVDLE